jgi:hypothetical protein
MRVDEVQSDLRGTVRQAQQLAAGCCVELGRETCRVRSLFSLALCLTIVWSTGSSHAIC